MQKGSFTGRKLLSIFTVFAGCVLETSAIYVFIRSDIQARELLFFPLAALHIAALAAFSFGMYTAGVDRGFSNPWNWAISCFTAGAVFPGAGLVGMAVIFMFLSGSAPEKGAAVDNYEQYITYDSKPDGKFIDAYRLLETVDEELDVRPLVDVLGENDVKLRRSAVSIMEALPKKDAARLLKMSLGDNNVEIRFYAALGLSRIESELNKSILMSREEVDEAPASPSAHLSLANSYAEYYESGMLDPVTADHYMDLAINEYYKILDLGGADINVLNSIGNLEIQKKNYESALSKFRKVCEADPYNIFANVGVIQVYYETGRIEQAISLSRNIIDRIPATRGPMRSIIEYWSS